MLTKVIRPHVILNVAMTIDGKIDTVHRKGAAISSPQDRARVDRLRASVDAILVGGRTLLGDDPRLTIQSAELRQERMSRGEQAEPLKVGVVTQAHLRLESRFLTYGSGGVVIFTTRQTAAEQVEALQMRGVRVFISADAQVDLRAVMEQLSGLGIQRLLVEGGGTLNEALLRQGFVDELLVYIAPMIFGGASAPTLASGAGLNRQQALSLDLQSVERMGDGGVLLHYLINHSSFQEE